MHVSTRFRGTTLTYDELLIALENIVIDKVSTIQTPTPKKLNTSAPMDIGIGTKDDCD